MSGSTVLVLTHWMDVTVDRVMIELSRRGTPVVRCDPGDFPLHWQLAARLADGWGGELRLPDRTLRLDDVRCAYYRRPTYFEFPDTMSARDQAWARVESHAALGGIFAAVPRWLNHPVAIGRTYFKPVQLVEARKAGFRVPETLVTNDPVAAAKFGAEVGEVIYKPFLHNPVETANGDRGVYTTKVPAEALDDPAIGLAAHMFQEWIPKQYEVRLTVVDDAMFAARVDAHSDQTRVDWRTDYDAVDFTAMQLPDAVVRHTCALMDRLDLRFGAIDLIATPDGEYVFLEINPNGQWGWIEDATGMPIAAAIADALIKE